MVDSFAFATDGSFLPDGRHYVVRGYGSAAVYTFPGNVEVGRFDLPRQPQGEGIAVGADDTLYLSSEGLHSTVVSLPLPRRVQRAIAPPSSAPSAAPGATTEAVRGSDSAPDSALNSAPWAWLLGGAGAVAFVAVAGWLLIRRGSSA